MSSIKMILIFILTFVLFSTIATSIDECKGTLTPNLIPCLVLLPKTTTSCVKINVSFYNKTTYLYSQNMSAYNNFVCNATFKRNSLGTYTFNYSTGDTGSIVVEEDKDNRYYLYMISFILFVGLIIGGFALHDGWLMMLSGFLSCGIAVSLGVYGFPLLESVYLKTITVILFTGIGFYFIMLPFMDFIEEFDFGMGWLYK